MIEKASSAGWVIQVTIPADPPQVSMPRSSSALPDAPTFKYFNVAIADGEKAIAATKKHLGESQDREVTVVRTLSSEEIAALHLKPGQVKQA